VLDNIEHEILVQPAHPTARRMHPMSDQKSQARAQGAMARGDRAAAEQEAAVALDLAKAAIADRGLNYGKPEDNFARIARRWRVHVLNRFGLNVPFDGASVAIMCDDIKSARIENDPNHIDSWVDKARYRACDGEIAASGTTAGTTIPDPIR
jgi:hypothetical protein